MTKTLKRMTMALVLAFALFMPVLSVSTVGAVDIAKGVCDGSGFDESANCEAGSADADVTGFATKVVNWFSWIVGIVSVIMIIVGGFKYITSGGASDKVTSAKNTIVYAVIGLIIVALAQFIVRFVLSQSSDLTS